MRLSDEECCVLMKIADRTKMDCWFSIRSNKQGEDYIYDWEYRKRMSLRSGIVTLLSGVAPPYGELLSHDECVTLLGLLGKLQLRRADKEIYETLKKEMTES